MTEENKSKKFSFTSKILIAFGLIILISLVATGVFYYLRYFGPNVTDKEKYLYIKTGSDFTEVVNTIKDKGIVRDTTAFISSAQNMDYTDRIKPGKYRLKKGMSNRALINMLKAGNQEPVRLKFQYARLKENLAGLVSKQLEADSLSLITLLYSDTLAAKYGFDNENFYTMFIPNSYEFYWNTSAEKFVERMHEEYEKFWTAERVSKATAIDLTPIQVSILAAIVDAEALHDDEMPQIAGLYMNRYKKGIRLQADPTVIYATQDFTIRRVLNKHLRTMSPYNTYLNSGLPPGPIMMPSINAIDAVLNYKKHNFIYMCAKDDFSGYHNFAVTEAEHRVNARKFQQALDKRNIKK